MTQDNKTYITQSGLEKLKQKYQQLISQERQDIAKRIQEAKELGDLSENAEYSAAKDEQAFLEMRIAELDNVIKNAVIIEENGNSKEINVGSRVKFKDESGNVKEYQIVGSHEADPTNGKISNASPMGRAFLGKKKGESIEFQAPKGIIKYKILSIK